MPAACFSPASAAHVSDFVGSPLLQDGLLLGQVLKWVPTWLTPIWVFSVGIAAGAVIAAFFYAILALMSYVPVLGKLADSPRLGITASLFVGVLAGLALCGMYMPTVPENAAVLALPLMILGIVLGFGVIYGMWHRTRSEWFAMVGEGVIPYILGTLGAFALVGLFATPLVVQPMRILESIPAVHLVGDGTTRLTVDVPAASLDVDPDDATFHPADIRYDIRSMSSLIITSDRTVLLADGDGPANFGTTPYRVNAGDVLEYRYENRDTPPLP